MADTLSFPSFKAPTMALCDQIFLDIFGEIPPQVRETMQSSPLASSMAHAWTYAPYLKALLRGIPEQTLWLAQEGPAKLVAKALQSVQALKQQGLSTDQVMSGLRQAKSAVALATALADIAGLWTLEQVTGALSDLADSTCDTALMHALFDITGVWAPDGFTVLSLGKLGGRDLNYSSDIDLILLFDPERLAGQNREEIQTIAVRVAQRFVRYIAERTPDGYVFRVDLRLRPDPDVTPLALPLAGAETYYQSSALPWERSAFVKARTIAGDIAMGDAFLSHIRPFIWRRSLDYTVLRDIRDMSLHIREHFEQQAIVLSGYDVKRGRGGIREVEFFVQIHQMIHGGRDVTLQQRSTLSALKALVAASLVPVKDALTLEAAYRFQRALEHRLQMLDDAQTHRLPTTKASQTQLARFCGYDDFRSLGSEVRRMGNAVAHLYDSLVEPSAKQRSHIPVQSDAIAKWASANKLPPTEMISVLDRWRSGRYRALRSERARGLLEEVLPKLASALAHMKDPRLALLRFDDFLSNLPSGVQIFSLFQSNPKLLDLVARLLTVAPPVAEALRRTPELLDVVLDSGGTDSLLNPAILADILKQRLNRSEALEEKLDEVRRFVAEYQFLIAVRLLEGGMAPDAARSAYTALADLVIAPLADAVIATFSEKYGHVPGGELIILALGRYGARGLTFGSDLDLVFLFTGAHDTSSTGPTSLPATLYFNRLAQRLMSALSTQTAAGGLFEVDTRLRPSGQQGLLAVTVDSFIDYEATSAWTWEHMALTQARPVYGSQQSCDQLIEKIAYILSMPRDENRLKTDVLDMRAEMDRHMQPRSRWDVKRCKGGLIDIEFIAQYLRLHNASLGKMSALGSAVATFQEARDKGILDQMQSDQLEQGYTLLSALQTLLRLAYTQAPETSEISHHFRQVLAKATGYSTLSSVEKAVTATYKAMNKLWMEVLGVRRA